MVRELQILPCQYRRIPIIIELRGASPRTLDIWGVLGKFANPYGLNAQALYQLHRAGKLLIILEGFDEMDLVGDTEMLLAHFQQLWQLAREAQAKIIITGRPNLFTDDPQRRQALGIHTHRAHLPYTRAVHLDKMADPQIRQALRKTTPDVREGILTALADSPDQSSFAELVTRPSTLYQLSTVWGDEIGKDTRRLNAAAVIGKFIQNDYDRQSAKPVEMPLTADERSYFIMGIAVAMMLKNDYTNQIKKADLRDVVQKLLDNFPEIQPYRDAQQGRKQGKLPDRLKENLNALDTVFRDVIAGGILVTDLSGSDTLRFAHKSYLEYLVSDFYVNFILQDEEREYDLKIANAVRKALNFKDNQLEQSVDVDSFVAQLIANRIKLRDKNTGVEIPIEGNEEAYSKAIFDKLIPSWWGRKFPNLMFWLKLHKGLIPLHSIAILTMILGILSYLFNSKYLVGIVFISELFWFIGFYYFGLLKNAQKIEITDSTHAKKLRLWQNTNQLNEFASNLTKNTQTILYSNSTSNKIIVIINMCFQLAVAILITKVFAFAGVCTTVSEGAFASEGAIPFIIAFLGGLEFSLILGIAGTILFMGEKSIEPFTIFLGVFVIVLTVTGIVIFKFPNTIIFSTIVGGTVISLFSLWFIYSLYPFYKIALKDEQNRQDLQKIFKDGEKTYKEFEQTRQAEAEQPDA